MKPHAASLAVLLMLGDSFTEPQAVKELKECGVDTNLGFLMMMGYVRAIPASRLAIAVYGRGMNYGTARYEVTEAGKREVL